jgi:Tfp pilus assembly protein PilF
MSLINKMLSDLEKRDAFLKENQDIVLDGLYSAYDIELEERSKSNSLVRTFILLILLIITLSSAYLIWQEENNYASIVTINEATELEVVDEPFSGPELSSIEADNAVDNVTLIHEEKNTNSSVNNADRLLKLESSLSLNTPLETDIETSNNVTNRVESIYFQTSGAGINLVLKMPNDIDYLVYGLRQPNRTVIEIENAELGFMLEELEPVDPIVAIRYSIGENRRLKLVLESDKPLTIKKSMTSKNENIHDLVVVMEYEWDNQDLIDDAEVELYNIVEKNVVTEDKNVFKGELIKTPVNNNADAYVEKLFQRAYMQYKQGNISESLKLLNNVLDLDAGHINARSTLALILSQQGQTDIAYSILNEGLIQFPAQTDWITMYARFLLQDDKLIEAKNMLVKHSPNINEFTEYYALYAAVLQKMNNHDNAARIYRDLLQINPVNSVWWMGLGISLESLKRYEHALYAYQKAFKNPELAIDSRHFLSQRIKMLSNLLKDESA